MSIIRRSNIPMAASVAWLSIESDLTNNYGAGLARGKMNGKSGATLRIRSAGGGRATALYFVLIPTLVKNRGDYFFGGGK